MQNFLLHAEFGNVKIITRRLCKRVLVCCDIIKFWLTAIPGRGLGSLPRKFLNIPYENGAFYVMFWTTLNSCAMLAVSLSGTAVTFQLLGSYVACQKFFTLVVFSAPYARGHLFSPSLCHCRLMQFVWPRLRAVCLVCAALVFSKNYFRSLSSLTDKWDANKKPQNHFKILMILVIHRGNTSIKIDQSEKITKMQLSWANSVTANLIHNRSLSADKSFQAISYIGN